ncbi:CLC_0170 family protein [Cellulosilyticum sp. I15G10I2]|uniref:CLC_0170 family protein n=1 Tax=Cellulosilyticum sp. I15G10I2 TaxID=1892843 RepID=UPI00085C8E72|nr:CLC_0170 family protein [Cellulosilyticum sp. I15G10I2]
MEMLRDMFSIYIVVVMMGIGAYMVFIQSRDLIHVVKLKREGSFAKIVGWFYIAVSIIGVVIITL